MDNSVTVYPSDEQGLERLARYLIRSPVSLQRLHYFPKTKRVLYQAKQGHDKESTLAPVSKLRRQWADLIRRVYQSDPLVCPQMRFSNVSSLLHHPGSGDSKDSGALENPHRQNTRTTHPGAPTSTRTCFSIDDQPSPSAIHKIMTHAPCSKRTAQLAIQRACQQGAIRRQNGQYILPL